MGVDHVSRRLAWNNLVNARDLGGFVTSEGKRTRARAFVRADTLSHLTEEGKQAALDYGVRTIVDLRYPGEVRERPNPLAGHPGVHYHHVSLLEEGDRDSDMLFISSRAAWHIRVLEQRKPYVAEIMRLFVNAPEGGIVFHCFVGKDRTGVIAALLLDLVGVPQDAIIADYHVSEQNLETLHQQWLATFADEVQRSFMAQYTTCPPSAMAHALEYLGERYNGTWGYLRDAGLDEAELRALRERLLIW
ncbi:MAG: tyrosine-protein phosphatase [Anaerolineae bacterium]|nr:tyrosine-protein phosphatase [Thermoflexales bacterium]MDW8293591.1 tyrosine-protein phosphatase [Anaerolineae bacterium]